MVVGKDSDNLKTAQSMTELWLALTEDQKQLLKESIVVNKYHKNDIIYHEGDTPDDFFCLMKGKVKVYKEGVGGRQQIVRMVRPKEYFGYRAGFVGEQYLTQASALEDATVCCIPTPIIKQIIRNNQMVAIYFIKQLASMLGDADEKTVNLTQKHLRGRLAEALLRLKDSYGTEDDGKTLAVSVSREDLANLSNMTTSNAIRTLSVFATEKLVSIDGRKITLLDEKMLTAISENG